ncbi:MAG: hypothetical protein J7J27_03700 [Euryarchaeota archaeon]|nr:hypothetical protein [Euryarchaeota archaeon]
MKVNPIDENDILSEYPLPEDIKRVLEEALPYLQNVNQIAKIIINYNIKTINELKAMIYEILEKNDTLYDIITKTDLKIVLNFAEKH